MPTVWRHQLWIIVAAAIVMFTNLGSVALWDRDEPRNAGCAREMLERGDWVVPVFNDELRVHKPVLVYWLIMSAYEMFGVSEFAARFWSAVLGVGTALLTYHLGRILYTAEVGLWAALVLATSLMFAVASRAATPDSALIFCTTLALLIFAHGSTASLRAGGTALPGGWTTFAAMYAAMGVGVLAKGPVAVVLPTAAIGLYLLVMLPRGWETPADDSLGSRVRDVLRRLSPLRILHTAWTMRPLTALAVVALVAGPWYVWVGLRTEGQWIEQFLLTHNVNRFSTSMENHGGPMFYYVPAILLGMLPGSIFFGPAIVKLVGRIRGRGPWLAGDVLVVCWAGLIVLFFSLAGTKLPSYVLPAFPALALMIGGFLHMWLHEHGSIHRAWFPAAMACLAVLGVGLIVGLPIAARFALPGEELLGMVGLIPLAAAIACVLLARRGQRRVAMNVFAATSVLLVTVSLGYVSLRVDRHKNSKLLMHVVRDARDSRSTRIASYRHFRSTYAFYARQRVDELHRAEDVADFLDTSEDTYLVVAEEDRDALQPVLPRDMVVLARRPRFLKPGYVLLYGPSAARERLAGRDGAADHAMRTR